MVKPRSRVALLTFLVLGAATTSAQQPQPSQVLPQGQSPLVTLPPVPQGQAPVVAMIPPEVAAERDDYRRRAEASVPIEELIAQVAKSTGKQFLIDPRVRALVFAVPPLESPTYATLLSVLHMHGYMAVEIGGKVHVMPDANARQEPTRLLQRDDRSVPDDEVVTRVITLPGNNAAQLVPILRPMMPQYAHLAAFATDEANSKLIVTDTYANVRRITELVQTLGQ